MRIFTDDEQAQLANTLRQYREWVESCEAEATEKSPDMQAGIKALAAEAFIAYLGKETAPRQAGLAWEWEQRAQLDPMARDVIELRKYTTTE